MKKRRQRRICKSYAINVALLFIRISSKTVSIINWFMSYSGEFWWGDAINKNFVHSTLPIKIQIIIGLNNSKGTYVCMLKTEENSD